MPDSASTAPAVLAAMITPALLISASGTLVLSTSNRLSRVVDRVRVLSREAEALRRDEVDGAAEDTQPRRRSIGRQLYSLAERAVLLRSAIAALYTAIGFLVTTSVSIGILTWVGHADSAVPIALAMAGASALLWGSVQLVREGRLAIGTTLEEMTDVRALIGERPHSIPPKRRGE